MVYYYPYNNISNAPNTRPSNINNNNIRFIKPHIHGAREYIFLFFLSLWQFYDYSLIYINAFRIFFSLTSL